MRIAAAALLAALLASGAVARADTRADTPADTCDRLAAEPGMALEGMDADAAIAACAAALEAAPDDAHLAHQYARALERAGRIEDARRLYRWAADDGYAPAMAALERLAPADAVTAPDPSPLLEALPAALARYAASLPDDPAEPLTVLAEIGTDPAAILDWVAANTRLVAYRGALRGASGVLLDRAGNSLDRALLLAALLASAGQEVRLAHATLGEAAARTLVAATARTVVPPAPPETSIEDAAAFFLADPRFDPAIVEEAAAEAAADAARSAARLAERRAALLPVLAAIAAPHAAEADRTAEADALAALADHWWVQMRGADGWRDLDPDRVGAVAAETLAPDALPDDLRHTVALRVVLELQDGAGRREEALLSWQGRPAELIDRPILFTHLPRDLGAMDMGALAAGPDRLPRMMAALDRESAWMPILQVGDDVVVDRLFTSDGRVLTADTALFADAGKAAGDLFGAAGTALGAPATASSAPAIASAEWLEITIQSPGALPVVERRTVFDLAGPAARAARMPVAPTAAQARERGLALLGQTQILIAGGMPSPLQAARIASRDLAGVADRLFAARSGMGIETAPTPPLLLADFASRRLSGGVAASAPTVVMQHLRLRQKPDATLRRVIEIDIVAAPVTAAKDPFEARLAQGVEDTILEALPFDGLPGTRNAATFHAEDLAAGRPWTTIDRAALSTLPADDAARLSAALDAGAIVVAPQDLAGAAAAGRLAWWHIDPRTGATLGMLDDGAGAAMVEYQQIVNAVTPAFCAFFMVGAVAGGGGESTAAVGLAVCAAGGLLGLAETVAVPGLFIGSGIGISSLAAYLLRHGI